MDNSSGGTLQPTEDEEESDKYILGNDVEKFFDNVFNRGGNPHIDRRYLKTSIPDKKEDCITFKLIQSKLVSFPHRAFKLPPLSEESESYTFYVPGVPENTSILFPAFSSLNKYEQGKLYRYHCLSYYRIRQLDERETAEFKELLSRAKHDYSPFQSYVHSQWIRHHCQRSLQIPEEVLLYTDHLWQTRAKQCLELYPTFYKSTSVIPLDLNDPNEDWTVMDSHKVVLRRGTPLRMILPSLKKPYKLLTDFRRLSQIKPVSTKNKTITMEPVCHQRLPVSQETNVDYCLRKEQNVDVVISSGAIKTIVDINRFKRDWVLPVTIKNIMLNDGETNKKVVIIDKKLPPQHMSVHDKNTWHAKIASKWALILANAPHLLENSNKTVTSAIEERQLNQYDDPDYNDCDVFGIDPRLESRKDPRDGKLKKSHEDSTHMEVETVSDVDLGEDEIFNIRQFLETTNYSHPSAQRQEEVKSEQKHNTPQQGSLPVNEWSGKKTTNYSHPSAQRQEEVKNKQKHHSPQQGSLPVNKWSSKKVIYPCEHYLLWQLHKYKNTYMMKNEQRTVNILVRTRMDGKLSYYQSNKRYNDEVCISSKLEFQPEYGASRMDCSELVREYVDLYLRPMNKLVRVRSVGHTKEVMLNEVRSLCDIREDLQAMNVKTHMIFDPLYAVLTKLIDLPVGKYVLQHSAKMGAFASLMVEDPNGSNFSMYNYCCELKQSDVIVPPTHVDPFILTRVHNRDRIPPALFKPCPTHNCNFFKKPEPFGKKKKKRKGAARKCY